MWSFVPTVAAVAIVALISPLAPAQTLFLRPDVAGTEQFLLIFTSTPLTSTGTSANSLVIPSLTAVGTDGQRAQVEIRKGDGGVLSAKTGAGTVFTSVDYGVSNRGEGQSVLVRFHAKCQPPGGVAAGLPVELTAESVKGGVAFVATAGAKPLKSVSVMVFEPGATEPVTVTTDEDGRTPVYSKPGRYALKVMRFEEKKGEYEGRAYSGVWEYSTLVSDVK